MTPQQAEALAHRYHTSVAEVVVGTDVLALNPTVIDEIMASDFVMHLNGQEIRRMAEVYELGNVQRTALPDARITHHEAIVAGDRVVIRWSSEGTHRGPFGDVPATGKRIHFEGIDLFHLRDGKIVEVWIEFDNLGVLQQMGALPTPGQP